MLCEEGKISLKCFMIMASSILFAPLYNWSLGSLFEFEALHIYIPVFYLLMNLIIFTNLKDNFLQIGIRSLFLGLTFCLSILIICCAPFYFKSFGIYGIFLTLFHYSEFFMVAWCNPETLSTDSFLLNHSLYYGVALIGSWIEYLIELYFFPSTKEYYFFWILGSILCFNGEVLRKLAMITASRNFTHQVQYEKRRGHKLITHGIYSYMRHPSYVGWFWWSIGTQIILVNPICLILYAIISWKFFNDRIFVEEITLINFFGKQYFNYQKKAGTGLPFIKGYIMEEAINHDFN